MSEIEGGAEAGATLMSHLLELRARLVRAVIGVVVVFLCLMPFAGRLFEMVADPLLAVLPPGTPLVAREMMSPFMAPVKLAFYLAIVGTAPWLLYQAWAFVAPGLYRRERRLALPLLVSALLLFYAGCAFAYFLVLPGLSKFLVAFTPDVVAVQPDPTAYLDFVAVLFLAFGVSFELPVALVILVALGVVSPRQLAEWRGYAVIGIFVVAAVITPPDVFSQLMLAIPMCLLYEAGILAARAVHRRPAE